MTTLGISWLAIGVAIFIIVIFLLNCYVKTSPNTALIISGLRKKPRYLIGRGGFRVPFFEKIDKLYLGQVTVDIKTKDEIPTNDFINVRVDAVAKVQVDLRPETFVEAIKNFLNDTGEKISTEVQDTFEGNLREAIGAVNLKDLNIDREAFSKQVLEAANKDLGALGLRVLSTNIQNITDSSGLIKDLGADNTWGIKKTAQITKAQAERDISIAQSQAAKEANDVRVATETSIAEKNNQLAIKQAELKKESDTKKAESNAAYSIMEQEQQAIINQKTIDAEISKTKREQILSEEQVKVVENKYRAEVNKQSDAQKYAAEVASDAAKYQVERRAEGELEQRKRQAEAELFEAEKKAAARKAQAEAEKYAKLQEAEGIAAVGEAEAKAIEAKGIAEATALEKKADAYSKFNQAAILDMVVKVLPEMAENVAAPISSIDSVRIYGGGVDKMSSNVPAVLKQTFDTMKDVTGVDLADIMRAETLDAKIKKDVKLDVDGLATKTNEVTEE